MAKRKETKDADVTALWARHVDVLADAPVNAPKLPVRETWPDKSGMITCTARELGKDAARMFEYPAFTFIRAEIDAAGTRTLIYRGSATTWFVVYRKMTTVTAHKSGMIPLGDTPH